MALLGIAGWLLFFALALLVGPAPAGAATVSLQDGVFRYEAAPGEQNDVLVALSPEDHAWLRIGGDPQPVPGPGCELHTFEDPPSAPYRLIECRLVDGVGTTRAAIALGDGRDSATIDAPLSGTIRGGRGPDGLSAAGRQQTSVRLYGEAGNDRLSGVGRVSVVARGGPGDDELSGNGRLDGGPGDDSFDSYDARSVMVLGPGEDSVVSPRGDGERDVIRARDGGFDRIQCVRGEKLDQLSVDALDWTSECEARQIARSGAVRALPLSFRADPRLRQASGLFVTLGCPP